MPDYARNNSRRGSNRSRSPSPSSRPDRGNPRAGRAAFEDGADQFAEGGNARRGRQVNQQWYKGSQSDKLRFMQEPRQHPDKYLIQPRQHQQPPRGYGRQPQDSYNNAAYDRPAGPPPSDGSRDAAGDDSSPLHIILVRGMKYTTDEDVFAKALNKLYLDDEKTDLGGATPDSLKRIMLIRERYTDESMGFGFAEYFDVKDAQLALKKSKLLSARGQLTISSTQVTLCFPHMGIFPQESFNGRELNNKFKFVFNGREHKYHDTRYYVSPLEVNTTPPQQMSKSQQDAANAERKSTSKTKKQDDGLLETNLKKRKAPGTAAPAIFGSWANKQAELRGERKTTTEASDATVQLATGVNAIEATTTTADQQTFAHEDARGIVCYLCLSQFQTKEGIHRHLCESTKHAENLENDEATSLAYERLKKKGIDPATTIAAPPLQSATDPRGDSTSSSRGYVDRAAIRREEEGKVGGGAAPKVGFSLKKRAAATTAAAVPSASALPASENKPTYGKGADMLAKHGWTAGHGLGLDGAGLEAPIAAGAYSLGVGLGHSGSKLGDAAEEAGKATEAERAGYAEAGKEKMRERYHGV